MGLSVFSLLGPVFSVTTEFSVPIYLPFQSQTGTSGHNSLGLLEDVST